MLIKLVPIYTQVRTGVSSNQFVQLAKAYRLMLKTLLEGILEFLENPTTYVFGLFIKDA